MQVEEQPPIGVPPSACGCRCLLLLLSWPGPSLWPRCKHFGPYFFIVFLIEVDHVCYLFPVLVVLWPSGRCWRLLLLLLGACQLPRPPLAGFRVGCSLVVGWRLVLTLPPSLLVSLAALVWLWLWVSHGGGPHGLVSAVAVGGCSHGGGPQASASCGCGGAVASWCPVGSVLSTSCCGHSAGRSCCGLSSGWGSCGAGCVGLGGGWWATICCGSAVVPLSGCGASRHAVAAGSIPLVPREKWVGGM